MRKLIFVLAQFIVVCSVYSQKTDTLLYPVEVRTPDNYYLVIMTRFQAQNAALYVDSLDNCREKSVILHSAIDSLLSVVGRYQTNEKDLKKVNAINSVIIAEYQQKGEIYEQEIKKARKEIRRQKFQKFIAIGSGIALAVAVVVLL